MGITIFGMLRSRSKRVNQHSKIIKKKLKKKEKKICRRFTRSLSNAALCKDYLSGITWFIRYEITEKPNQTLVTFDDDKNQLFPLK